jgi:hypothetical protein
MNQPRRKSSLSGANPVAPVPPAVATPTETTPAEPAQPASTTATTRTTQRTDRQPTPQRKYPPKVSFYQNPEDTARLRAAYRHTLAATSDRSLSDFITRVVMAEVERLENQYNGAQPFPSVGAGEIPQGRPVGE